MEKLLYSAHLKCAGLGHAGWSPATPTNIKIPRRKPYQFESDSGGQRKNMSYDIISADSYSSLIRFVSQRLYRGWKLHGSPFVFGREMCQAMILP